MENLEKKEEKPKGNRAELLAHGFGASVTTTLVLAVFVSVLGQMAGLLPALQGSFVWSVIIFFIPVGIFYICPWVWLRVAVAMTSVFTIIASTSWIYAGDSWWIYSLASFSLAVLTVAWFSNSIDALGPDEVALKKWFGRLDADEFIIKSKDEDDSDEDDSEDDPEYKDDPRILTSGIVFVPWGFDIMFGGHPLCRLIRIPKRHYLLSIEGKTEHEVWSKDRIPLRVDISVNLRLPFLESGAIAQVIQSGVPFFDQEALDSWMSEEIIAGVRDICAEYNHDEVIAHSSLKTLRKKGEEFFRGPHSLFSRSGLCGMYPWHLKEGHGEVVIRIEKVSLATELEEAMQKKVLEGYLADAAKETSRRNAEEVGGQVLRILSILCGVEIESLSTSANKKKRGIPIADGGYREWFEWAMKQTTRDRAGAGFSYSEEVSDKKTSIDISSAGGRIDPNVAAILGAVTAAGEALGGGRKGGRSSRGRGDKKPQGSISRPSPIKPITRQKDDDEE